MKCYWEGAACGRWTLWVVGKVCSCVLTISIPTSSVQLDPLRSAATDQRCAEELLRKMNWFLSVATMKATTSGSRPWWRMISWRLCPDGGELAAMTMIDATVRLIPEVIGKKVQPPGWQFLLWSLRVSSIHPALWIQRNRQLQMPLWVAIMKISRQWRLSGSLKDRTSSDHEPWVDSRRREDVGTN